MHYLLFYTLAALAILSGLAMVFFRRTIYSALALIMCFGATAGLFFQLGAPFVGAIQIIVYAGAIMVLFLFAIMLVDPHSENFAPNRLLAVSALAVPLAAAFFLLLWEALPAAGDTGGAVPAGVDVEEIAHALFTDYLLPFEVTSILMLVAVLGAVVLSRRSDGKA